MEEHKTFVQTNTGNSTGIQATHQEINLVTNVILLTHQRLPIECIES